MNESAAGPSVAAANKPPAPRSGWVNYAAAALIVLHAVLIWNARESVVGTGGDDAFYISLARSVREGSYREIHRFDRPFHAQYPPGYPILLAALGDYSENIDAATLLGIGAATVSLIALFSLARRTLPLPYALGTLALVSLNPQLIQRTGQVTSEAAFTAATMGALWLAFQPKPTRRTLVGVAVLALTAAMIRSVGVALVAVILLAWVLERRWKAAFAMAGSGVLVVGGWLAWTALAPRPALDRSYSATLRTAVESQHYNPLASIMNAAERYTTRNIPALVSIPAISDTQIDNIFWIVVISALLLIGVGVGWKVFRVGSLYFAAYLLLISSWPYHPPRFLLPIAPLLILFLAYGAKAVAQRARGLVAPAVIAVLTLSIVYSEVTADSSLLKAADDCRHRDQAGCYRRGWVEEAEAVKFAPAAAAFFDVAEFARKQLPPDAIVATVKEATFAYYSHRKVISHHWLERYHGAELADFMGRERIHYLLVSSLAPSPLDDNLVQHCSRFKVIYEVAPVAYLLELSDASLDPETSACAMLEAWARKPKLLPN